uniref:Dihydroorotate dehydrogenase electron transfer subunit n=1 Tax=uncultured bacterium contig00063 TaxID=1181546 RepID=A0A806KKW0_9BACT|nr:dihydroorotate dehydrogenase electron transfer subunit [uncultured bacterium contig00063]
MRNEECPPSSVDCELIANDYINKDIFRLVFVWQNDPQTEFITRTRLAAPKAGQFFMIKPQRSAVFLGRPISVAKWELALKDREYIRRKVRSKGTAYQRYLTGKYLESDVVTFLIALRGRGTEELAVMRTGERAELIGPLGNAWTDFLPPAKKGNNERIALVGGGMGMAPLNALLCESPGYHFHVYAGFKTGFRSMEAKRALLGPAYEAEKLVLATENGKEGLKGRVPDFLKPDDYAAVCACGPEPMLKAVAEKCKASATPCFVSLERRMACGVGACLGCTVRTVNGNRRCCADGPIFKADEVVFSE